MARNGAASGRGRREPGWYYRLSSFFRERFGGPVYKIPLDAGFTCPNRDGTISNRGCSYCYNPSFSPQAAGPALSVTEQIQRGKKRGARDGGRYLAYFQAYTNTYAPLEQLKRLYDEALQDPEVVGLSVATRPDCVPGAVLDLLESYARTGHVWIEYGLQSAHDCTLERINRGHSYAQFRDAVRRTAGRGIFVCAHVILGLPGETAAMMLETVARLNECGLDGVKFHHLQVIGNTLLAEEYRAGKVDVFATAADYIPLLCDCLERLDPSITVHRLAASVTGEALLVAPRWPESPTALAANVEVELRRRGTWQGSKVGK